MFTPLIKSDTAYLSGLYFLSHGKKMDWSNPVTFNEKLNYLKLWSKDRGFEQFVDKYSVRDYVAKTIGSRYLIPLLGVWDSIEDIDFSSLPEEYVLKTTHDSGGVAIIKGKPDPAKLRNLSNRLRRSYFPPGREYPYLKVKPRLIAEQLLRDPSGDDIKDYKFFCFNGEPRVLFVASDRFNSRGEEPRFDYFDMELHHLPVSSKGHANNPQILSDGVEGFEEMKQLAAKLSTGFPFIRIDFYNIAGQIYFGEMTFFHDDATVPLRPAEWNETFGRMIELPE